MGIRAFATTLLICLVVLTSDCLGQFRAETPNFVVVGNDQKFTEHIAKLAEDYRKKLSIEWLGRELPTWRQKCPIHYRIEMHARGETSFVPIPNSEPIDWDMRIYGPPDRLLDAVLPHEITHTIFATHFQRPLPRWADEGACTTVEHVSEREKNHRMLMKFLRSKPSRGIPFNRMFTLREYPRDMLPLYAQGYSVAKFLIMQKGKRHFVNFIGAGLAAEDRSRQPTESWDRVTREFYGFEHLSDLQISWLKWVRSGSQPFDGTKSLDAVQPAPQAIVSNSKAPGKLRQTFTSNNDQPGALNAPTRIADVKLGPGPAAEITKRQSAKPQQNSWYARQAQLPREHMSPDRTLIR